MWLKTLTIQDCIVPSTLYWYKPFKRGVLSRLLGSIPPEKYKRTKKAHNSMLCLGPQILKPNPLFSQATESTSKKQELHTWLKLKFDQQQKMEQR